MPLYEAFVVATSESPLLLQHSLPLTKLLLSNIGIAEQQLFSHQYIPSSHYATCISIFVALIPGSIHIRCTAVVDFTSLQIDT